MTHIYRDRFRTSSLGKQAHEEREAFKYEQFLSRLEWAHGPQKALAIGLGQDPATNEDVRRWKALGR